ncbi:DUF7134 domain-containing protein [Cryptosporangium phraense]|uniref:DUF7134 domain-containing protein n=1 Tax=Cryptosporangium phraense TaxID=2593070 RepID=A0A545AT56_9ACTN|nr:hypothetical protein [Cryptosporangium phraense]TQS43785.1 hypothetical protein FL583_17275 [Cryptosporangium phraense]
MSTLEKAAARQTGKDLIVLPAGFLVDVLTMVDPYILQKAGEFDRTSLAALALGALGFTFLAVRRHFPLTVFWLVVGQSLALSALTDNLYTSLIGVWIALAAVAQYGQGPLRYAALLASAAPSIVVGTYLYSVLESTNESTVPLLITGHAIIILGAWKLGSRRRVAQ